MKSLPQIIFPALISILVGCASPNISIPNPSLNDENSAIIEIRRTSTLVNAGVYYRVFIGEEYIGELLRGGRLLWRVPAGQKTIIFKRYEAGFPGFGGEEISLEVDTGYKYYVTMGHQLNGITAIAGITTADTSSKIDVRREKIGEDNGNANRH